MRQYLKGLAFIISLVWASITSHAQNLIANGGFESGTTGWASMSGGGGAATFGLVTTDKKEGTQSYQADVSTLGANTWSIQTLGPTWNATLYQTYSITFWAKSSVAGAKLNIIQQNQNYSVTTVTLTTSWAQYQYDYVAFEMSPQFKIQYLTVGTYLVDGISVSATTIAPPTGNELKTLAARCNLNFGAAVSDGALQNDADYINTLKKEFSMVVAENVMKMGSIKPTETGAYNFGAADRLVNFALANGIKVRGHTLVWHSQLPSWVETKTWTKASLLAYLKEYITTVVGRYKGKITEWDVANECIDDASGNPIRSSVWFDVIGEEVLDSAFKWTNQIDPNAKLFYNDYSAETMNSKSNAVYALVSRLKSRKAPIHGVGFQSHIGYTTAPSMTSSWITQADQNIKRLGALGLQVAITELDLGIPVPFDATKYATQAISYGNILRLALNNPSIVKTFTLWGFTDKYSWIPGFSQGKNGAALILYEDYTNKPAYDELVSVFTANCPIPTNCTAKITPSGATTFCPGGKVDFTTNIGASYKWLKGTTQVATSAAYTATASGSYTVEVTYANGCKAVSPAVVVTVNAAPTATITTSGATTFCQGGSVNLTSSTGSSYVWRNGTTTVGTTSSYLARTAGKYTVIVTNASGCKDTSAAATVTVNTPPTATITASGATNFCQGGSVNLTSSTGSSYVWRNGTTTVGTTSSYLARTAGRYTVIVTNASGCKDTSAATTVTVNAVPTATITASGATTFCQGGSVNLTSSTGSSYVWRNGTTTVGTTSSYLARTSGSYSVIVTNASGCKDTSAITNVTVNAAPTATITSPSNSFCTGDNLSLSSSRGTSYVWRNGTLAVGTSSTYTAKTAGSYTVIVTNASGCKDTSAVKSITENPLPVLTHNTRTDNVTWTQQQSFTVCVGDNVYTGPWPNLATGWSWTGPNSFTSTLRNPIINSISSNQAGKYTATYTDPKGCSASLDLTIAVSVPTATIISPATSFCPGGSVAFAANVGTSYVWRNGTTAVGTSSTYTARTPGSYTVIVADANGCKDTSAIRTITVNPVPVVSITSPANNATLTSDIFPINATVTGTNISNVSFYNGNSLIGTDATSPFSFTTPSLTNGTYTFSAIARNTFNCADTAKVTVKVNKVVTAVEEVSEKNGKVSVSPNPFQNHFVIEKAGMFDYYIMDSKGVVVESGKGSDAITLGENLTSGLYFVTLSDQMGITRTSLVKQ